LTQPQGNCHVQLLITAQDWLILTHVELFFSFQVTLDTLSSAIIADMVIVFPGEILIHPNGSSGYQLSATYENPATEGALFASVIVVNVSLTHHTVSTVFTGVEFVRAELCLTLTTSLFTTVQF
jgi:hypothetical protein